MFLDKNSRHIIVAMYKHENKEVEFDIVLGHLNTTGYRSFEHNMLTSYL